MPMTLRESYQQPYVISSMKLRPLITSIAENWSARVAIFVAMTTQANAFVASPILNRYYAFHDFEQLRIRNQICIKMAGMIAKSQWQICRPRVDGSFLLDFTVGKAHGTHRQADWDKQPLNRSRAD
jgi:hypothetical protein